MCSARQGLPAKIKDMSTGRLAAYLSWLHLAFTRSTDHPGSAHTHPCQILSAVIWTEIRGSLQSDVLAGAVQTWLTRFTAHLKNHTIQMPEANLPFTSTTVPRRVTPHLCPQCSPGGLICPDIVVNADLGFRSDSGLEAIALRDRPGYLAVLEHSRTRQPVSPRTATDP
jgi:hypothetical protein